MILVDSEWKASPISPLPPLTIMHYSTLADTSFNNQGKECPKDTNHATKLKMINSHQFPK